MPNSGAVKSIDMAGAFTSTRGYDSQGRMDSLTQQKGSDPALYGVTYGFNTNDQRNRADVTYRQPKSNDENEQTGVYRWDYTYDASKADQLATANMTVNGPGGTRVGVPGQQHSYAFDGVGNQTGTGYVVNDANQYTHHLIAGDSDLTYDSEGSLTNSGTFTFTYDSQARLTSATPATPAANSRKFEAGYDIEGRRTWKKSYEYVGGNWLLRETRKFVYDGWNLVAEFVQDDKGVDRLSRAYTWGQDVSGGGGIGSLLAIMAFDTDGATAAKTYIPLYDGSGNVTGLTDTNGKVATVYRYDPLAT